MLRMTPQILSSPVGRQWVRKLTHGWRCAPGLAGLCDEEIDSLSSDVDYRAQYAHLLLYMCRYSDEQREWVLDYVAETVGFEKSMEIETHIPSRQDVEAFKEMLATLSHPIRGQCANCLLYDAVQCMVETGQYSPEEKKEVRILARELGVPQMIIQNVEELVREEHELRGIKEDLWK
eukprot:PhM_4_TR4792/c0_g1_i1/m.47726